ncbi:hypothetical protein [Rossellomorea marisflavi]|uniref:hypothetical protein n=1 Tax=Rossellomorea marisflavi TaxID=189381 RepID=UPI00345D6B84
MSEKTAHELLTEAYGEGEPQEGVHGKGLSLKLTEEDKRLLEEKDEDSLPHMFKIRLGIIKRMIEQQEGKDNDNGNPDA